MADDPSEVATTRSTPWFGAFVDPIAEDKFFLFVEGRVLTTVNSFSKTLVMWFALYYIFNLEYPKQIKEVCFFCARIHVWSALPGEEISNISFNNYWYKKLFRSNLTLRHFAVLTALSVY